MPVYWTALEILNEACGALALATIVCILSRRLRAIRLAVVFQRWTSITLLITLAIRGNSPATDGDGIAWLIILPITTLFVILGFVASRYLNSASQRLAREPADKNLIPVDSNP